MKLTVAWIGKTKEPAIQSLTDEYLGRIGNYCRAEGVAFKDEAALMKSPQLARAPRFVVLLDSRGRQFSSEEFAEFLNRRQERNPQPMIFAVGPASGFSGPARAAADLLLSLGKMTFPHEIARVMLLEQIYRAFTIIKRHPYHLGH